MAILGVSATTIKRLADDNRLPSMRTLGGHRRFRRSAVEKLLQNDALSGADSDVQRCMQLLKTEPCRRILAELQKLRLRHTDWYDVSDLIMDVMQQIRDMSASGKYSLIEAQISSSTLQQALGTLAATSAAPALAKTALVGKIHGDAQAPGLSLMQLCLESSGIDTVSAGTELLGRQIANYLDSADIEIVALSASESQLDKVSFAKSYRAVAEACQRNSIDLILGGRGGWPKDLYYGHRCDSFADLRAVVAAL